MEEISIDFKYSMKIENNIVKQIGVFMTKEDGISFSKLMKDNFKNVVFIETTPSLSNEVNIVDNITVPTALNKGLSILNLDIFPLDTYKSLIKDTGNGYHNFSMIGNGLIQYVASEIANYDNNSLKNGYFGGSYFKDDKLTADFVKKTFSLIGSQGSKVFLVSRNKKLYADNPEKFLLAWPSASKKYNGDNGRFLTQTRERVLLTN
jgi:hypothetical protein